MYCQKYLWLRFCNWVIRRPFVSNWNTWKKEKALKQKAKMWYEGSWKLDMGWGKKLKTDEWWLALFCYNYVVLLCPGRILLFFLVLLLCQSRQYRQTLTHSFRNDTPLYLQVQKCLFRPDIFKVHHDDEFYQLVTIFQTEQKQGIDCCCLWIYFLFRIMSCKNIGS